MGAEVYTGARWLRLSEFALCTPGIFIICSQIVSSRHCASSQIRMCLVSGSSSEPTTKVMDAKMIG